MQVLFVTSEAHPLIKTGGLADVSGALPAALNKLGVDTKIMMPGYQQVLDQLINPKSLGHISPFPYLECEIIVGYSPQTNTEILAIKNDALYIREGKPYSDMNGKDWEDNALRFATLAKIASLLSQPNALSNWLPDVVHCNDWQAGLTPYYLYLDEAPVKTLMSVHNMAFQGCFDQRWIVALSLNPQDFNINGYEYFNQISFLKAGLYYADEISTVSPTYAQEIQTEAFGFGMQGLLKSRSDHITGILNGIDDEEWDPEMDPHLPYPYKLKNMAGKAMLKQHLLKTMQLPESHSKPLLGVVSRLTHQKGLDILVEAMPELIAKGYQLVILGSGDSKLEQDFMRFAKAHPNQVAVTIGYNESLSHLIMAAIDLFLMPSRFEPCGLNQFYGLRYGTPPLVSNTGGLADSVCNTNAETLLSNKASGFMIENVNKVSLLVTIEQASQYWQDKKTWAKIQANGMKQALGWENSANLYKTLYLKMIKS